MTKNKKNLIVTLADANFIDQAKQLFSSVYFKSGWQGDYLLLACGLSETHKNWFKNKGILVYDCSLLSNASMGVVDHPPVILSKLFIFKEYFKQWQKIIFLDADVIVRSPLDGLLELNGFNAPKANTLCIREEFISDKSKIKDKLSKYNLRVRGFNTGVFTFNSNLIKENTFDNLLSLYNEIKEICLYGDGSVLNIFFYKNWQELPITYNSAPWYLNQVYGLKNEKIIAHILHFFSSIKPWNSHSYYYHEWLANLKGAELIDLNNRPTAQKLLNKDLVRYLKFIKYKDNSIWLYQPIMIINKLIGYLGLLIAKKYPRLYRLVNLKRFLKLRPADKNLL